MARNRFEQYQSNPYQSQFVPTPIDGRFVAGALGARQKSFDTALDAASTFEPEISYYPGDREAANSLLNQYSQKSNGIVESLYADGDGNNAARTIAQMRQGYSKDRQTGEIAALAQRKAEYDASLTAISKIKDVDDRNRSMRHFQNTVHTEFGLDSPLNQPIILDNPGISEKALAIGKAIKANGWMIGDGRMMTSDDDGMYKVTVNGHTTQIDPNDAYDIIENYLLGDEQVRSYMGNRQQIGDPVDLRNTIASIANAVGFTNTTGSYGFHKDVKKGIDYEQGERPITIGLDNPTLLIKGMTMSNLNTEIKNATGAEKAIMEGYRYKAKSDFDNSENGFNLKLTEENKKTFQDETINQIISDNGPLAKKFEISENVINKFLELSPSDFYELFEKQEELVTRGEGGFTFNLPNSEEKIFSRFKISKSENNNILSFMEKTSVNDKINLYKEELNEYMKDGYSTTGTDLIPSKVGSAATAYQKRFRDALNGNHFQILPTDGTERVDSKTNEEKLLELGNSNPELVGITYFEGSVSPPIFKIKTKDGVMMKLAPKYTNMDDRSLPFIINQLIKDLDITGDRTSSIAEDKVLENMLYNANELYDTGNPNQNVSTQLNIKDVDVKPYTNKSLMGNKGSYIEIKESEEISNYSLSDLKADVKILNLPYALEDIEYLENYYKDNSYIENEALNFDWLPDDKAKEKIILEIIRPAIYKRQNNN